TASPRCPDAWGDGTGPVCAAWRGRARRRRADTGSRAARPACAPDSLWPRPVRVGAVRRRAPRQRLGVACAAGGVPWRGRRGRRSAASRGRRSPEQPSVLGDLVDRVRPEPRRRPLRSCWPAMPRPPRLVLRDGRGGGAGGRSLRIGGVDTAGQSHVAQVRAVGEGVVAGGGEPVGGALRGGVVDV